MSDLSKQYLAGLFDGESWIGFTKNRLRISVQMVDKGVVERIFLQCGGGFYKVKRREGQNYNTYCWNINGVAAASLLKELLPFFVVKKSQAEVGIRWGAAEKKKDKDHKILLGKQMAKLNNPLGRK